MVAWKVWKKAVSMVLIGVVLRDDLKVASKVQVKASVMAGSLV